MYPVHCGHKTGPTLVQLLSNSPTPPQIHMVKTGHGPVQTMASNLPLQPPAPMQSMPMQLPVPQDNRDAINQAPVYPNHNQAPAAAPVPQQMYQPPMFQPPPPGNQQVYPPHMLGGYPNTAGIPPHMHTQLPTVFMGTGVHPTPMHIQRFPPASCNSSNHPHPTQHQGSNGDLSPRQEGSHRLVLPRPNRPRDERADKQRSKLQKKLHERHERQKENSSLSSSPQSSPRGMGTSHPGVLRPTENGTSSRGTKKKGRNSPKDESEENPQVKKLKDLLSSIQIPEVEQVTARSATVRWSMPEPYHSGQGDEDLYEDHGIDPAAISYELKVLDKAKNSSPGTIYSNSLHHTLTDLKPATEYQLSVSAILDGIHGSPSRPVILETNGCPPDVPLMPRLTSRTKNFLVLSWKASNSNGSKIHSYLLQCDKGNGSSGYVAIYEGPDKQYKITKLQPSTLYRFRLQAINSHGSSGFSEEAKFYTSGSVPPVPSPPTLIEALARSLKLQWQRGPGDIHGYCLEMDDESKRYGFQVVYRGEETSHSCKNLARNSDYKFRLCAFNEEGNSRWSSIVAFRTMPDAPRAPSKPSLKGKLHSTSFKIMWDPPRDCGGSEVTSYQLEKAEVRNGPFSPAYRGMEREHQFDNLKPGCTYYLRVSCTSKGGTSPCSEVFSITTLPIVPGQSHSPRVHGKPKATSVNLRWGMPDYNGGAPITEFSVEMTAADNNVTSEVHRATADITECTVNSLLPGRTYDFRLRSCNKIGYGPYSEPLRVSTGAGPPDAPTELTASCVTTSVVLLSWQKPCFNGADITEYRVEKASENGTFSLAYSGSATTCEIRGLQPATYYYLRVQALNAAGHGPFSSVVTCQTLPSSPEAVPSLRVVSSTSDSLLIQWTEPSDCGSEIIAYNLDIGEGQPIFVEGNVTQYCVDQLEPDTKYRIRVQALNSIGEGPYSAVLKAITRALPPIPPRLECIYYSHQSLKLKWGDQTRTVGDSKSLNFTLEMEDKRGRFVVVYSGVNVTQKVTRLSESTTYKFRILASNEAGTGPYSEDFVFATTKAPPVTLKAPILEVDQDSCQISWAEAVLHQQDDLMHYQCQYQRTREGEARVIYRGPEKSFKLEHLELNIEHRVRVCAIRVPGDGSSELVGIYSPWASFTITPPAAKEEALMADGDGDGLTDLDSKPMGDSQLAMIIVACFCVIAILIAVFLQWYLGS
ncbi:fibronectin type-III domain-containing protein 3A-like isoform X2 [Lytechinus variegatus]|uniref:fibronectin type-III domain-containing protein 3A-like isoform X2 n=1 Tax=Lytechinus variegatus TaxID=7654 RepID=UPI001BB1DD6C|nr:fibronectin type-III domain-containing protein 3A-like isoform X2 [Lytechinus variegatus]